MSSIKYIYLSTRIIHTVFFLPLLYDNKVRNCIFENFMIVTIQVHLQIHQRTLLQMFVAETVDVCQAGEERWRQALHGP